jgi:hypothetical protein
MRDSSQTADLDCLVLVFIPAVTWTWRHKRSRAGGGRQYQLPKIVYVNRYKQLLQVVASRV